MNGDTASPSMVWYAFCADFRVCLFVIIECHKWEPTRQSLGLSAQVDAFNMIDGVID